MSYIALNASLDFPPLRQPWDTGCHFQWIRQLPPPVSPVISSVFFFHWYFKEVGHTTRTDSANSSRRNSFRMNTSGPIRIFRHILHIRTNCLLRKIIYTQKRASEFSFWSSLWKEAATYSPALHCSTIGASRLNFSVRNGKRWNPAAITTWYIADLLTRQSVSNKTHTVESVCYTWESFRAISSARLWRHRL